MLNSKKATTWWSKISQSNGKLLRKKNGFYMSHGTKKYLSTRAEPIIYTLEKSLVSCFFSDRVKKICNILWYV